MLLIALSALALLLVAWIGYPLWLVPAARHTTPLAPFPATLPRVCAVIATRETPELVAARVRQLRTSDYPADQIDVVVTVDFRSVHPLDTYRDALAGIAHVVRGDQPGGKAAALNAGVRAASEELVILADSQQTFNAPAIGLLVRAMQDPAFAAVSGAVAMKSGDGLMDLYWRYERQIRSGQAAVHSVVSTTGQLCAVRRSLWPEMPAELICDDLYLTMRLVLAGHRVGYCPEAQAHDERSFTREQHFQRKVRTLTGLVQVCAWVPAVLWPWRNPIWIHFACHKLVRLITPYLALIAAVGIGVAVAEHTTHLVGLLSTALGLITAAALLRPRAAARRFGQLRWAARLQLVPLIAMWNGLRGHWHVWHAHRPVSQVTVGTKLEPDVLPSTTP